jgi:phytoene desaturase
MRVIIVGAGLGGLSAALYIRGRGHDVQVVEREPIPGGRAGELRLGAYRFDTGPTVMTMPGLLRNCFAAAGLEMDDYVTLRKVDPMYRATFQDGSELRVWHDRDRMREELRSFAGPSAVASFDRFVAWVTELYHLEMPNFMDRNFDSVLDVTRPISAALRLVRMGGFRKLGAVVRDYFPDERLQRMFSFQSMYAGMAPMEALAVYCVITYMDSVEGVYFPEGGMHALGTSMAAAAAKAGVSFRHGATVEKVLQRDGQASGVRLVGGEVLEADAVVCNPDLPVAYRELLDVPMPRVARTGRYSPSCILWHAGVKGTLPAGAAHHNIHFGGEWDGAFKALIHDGVRMPDPSILVTLHSKDQPSDAPPGCSTLYVLEPTPNLDGKVDWKGERSRIRADLAARVAAHGYPTDVEVEAFVDPVDWQRAGMERGTPFALAHKFFQTGPFRPNNVDARIPGVVFVGSSTLPGVGVPMVLISGRLAAERIDELARKRPAR